MTVQVKVCVDAMGGDCEPEAVLEGIHKALQKDNDLSVLVAGDKEHIESFCAQHERASALFTTQSIAMDEHPAQAVREKRDSSIVQGCKAVKESRAQGFFSAGSTGAVMAAATLNIGRIKTVKRPFLAAIIQTLDQHNICLCDLGANADVRPENIVVQARAASVYSHLTLGIENPSVALLSNGTEDTKGSEMAQSYFKALSQAQGINFKGNCEGNDILLNSYDVIVTDGFTGNVALKSIEGSVKFIAKALMDGAKHSVTAAAGALLIKKTFKQIASELSGDKHGGAVLLGCKAPVVIGHGATSPEAVMHGTLACAHAIRTQLSEKIAEAMAVQDK